MLKLIILILTFCVLTGSAGHVTTATAAPFPGSPSVSNTFRAGAIWHHLNQQRQRRLAEERRRRAIRIARPVAPLSPFIDPTRLPRKR